MTVQDAVNRGFNLMVTAFLFLGGIAFGTVITEETDLPDKIDDAGFLALGFITLAWYFLAGKTKRSVVPVVLVAVAVANQILGVILEHDDKNAFGDNIGGMFLFIPLLIFVSAQYFYFNKKAGA
jgi:hypothetical protein